MDLGFRLSRFLVGLPQFFVRAVVTGDGFLGLWQLNFFVSRGKGLRNFCVGVALSGSAVGLSRFFVLAAQRKMLCLARAVDCFVSRRA